MNIYEVSQKYRQLLEMIENEEVSQETLQDTLDSLKDHIVEALENLSNAYLNKLAHAKALKEEAKRLAEKAKAQEKSAERTLQFMDSIMRVNDLKNVDAGIHSIKYYKGREVINVDNSLVPTPEERPDLYQQEWKMLGKTELKKLIQAGEEIQGVSIERNPDSLQIK